MSIASVRRGSNVSSVLAGGLAVALAGVGPAQGAIDIVFDYTYDTGGFFTGNAAAMARLEQAASYFEAAFADDLTAIVPGTVHNVGTEFEFADSWTAIFENPSTGSEVQLVDLTISANQIIVYAGARDLDGPLGQGGPGSFSTFGVQSFVDTVATRGETGADATDFGPWGGAITFDTAINIDSESFDWHFGETTAGLDDTKYDFLSVAVHELAHLLGFGTAESWQNLLVPGAVSGTPGTGNATRQNSFVGALSQQLNGGSPVALENSEEVASGGGFVFDDPSHWLDGLFGDGLAMDPTLTNGQRNLLQPLDWAAMADLGWEVDPSLIPEPASAVLLVLAGALVSRRRVVG